MNKEFLRAAVLLFTFTIFSLLCGEEKNSIASPEPKTQPNIIYINTDDWGIGKVPCYKMDKASEKIIRTPNIDKLLADGMFFTNSYAANAVCGPSRCSLLTGKHPGHAVWRANCKTPPMQPWLPKEPMLGQVARDAGYSTAGFGKLSAGGTDTPENITKYGWDYWLGFLGHIDCRDFYSSYIWENGKKIDLEKNNKEALKGTVITGKGKSAKGGVVPDGKGTFIEDLYTDKIIEFIKKNTRSASSGQEDKPFFIYFASTVPHGGPPGGMRVPSIEGYDKNPEMTLKEQIYCALMTRHDKNVGRIRKAVEDLGIAENTIILWTSDNGDEDSYYERTKTFDGNGPYRKYKRYLYEGGIRTPLIAYWPGTIKPGSKSDLITSQIDLMPTLSDGGGKPITDAMDGISILPTLRGEPDKQTKRDYLYWEFYERGRQQAVRMGKWKGYRLNGPGNPVELYNLGEDSAEEKNLASQFPEIVKKIEEIMLKEHSPHPKWGFGKNTSNRKKKKKGKK